MTTHKAEIFVLDHHTHEPIYRQLMTQVDRMMASGQLVAGDTLPSVRSVAKYLGVAVMTVSKAYGMLTEMGVLEHVRGHSVQVAQLGKAPIEQRIKLLEPIMERLILTDGQLEIEHSALLDQFTKLLDRRQ